MELLEAPDRRDEVSVSLLAAASVLGTSEAPFREKRRCGVVSSVGVDGVDDGALKRDRGGSVVVGDVTSGIVVLTRRLTGVSVEAVGVDGVV